MDIGLVISQSGNTWIYMYLQHVQVLECCAVESLPSTLILVSLAIPLSVKHDYSQDTFYVLLHINRNILQLKLFALTVTNKYGQYHRLSFFVEKEVIQKSYLFQLLFSPSMHSAFSTTACGQIEQQSSML